MQRVLDLLLRRSPKAAPLESLDDWWRQHRKLAERFELPVDLALAAGFAADRLGYAFGSGYQAAGMALFPPLTAAQPGALCATEGGSAHPRSIKTRLDSGPGGELLLSGEKSFVTLGAMAQLLLIVASEGSDEAGRNRLRVVAIKPRQGVTITPIDGIGLVPEIPHASLRLERVSVAPHELLPGDGYQRYLKPFRTVEDCHVHAALLGWLLQIARRSGWPVALQEQLVAAAVTIRSLALADPKSAAVHIALAGALGRTAVLLEEAEPQWRSVDDATRRRWERDRPLLQVAGKARAKRLEAAWRSVAEGHQAVCEHGG